MLEEFESGLSQLPRILAAIEKKLDASKDFNKDFTAESLPLLVEYILVLLILEDVQCLAWFNAFQSSVAKEGKFEEYELIRRIFLTATLKLQGFKDYDWPKECENGAVLGLPFSAYFLFNPEKIFDCEKSDNFPLCFEIVCKIILRLASESLLLGYLAAKKAETLLERKFGLNLEKVQNWLAENANLSQEDIQEDILEKSVAAFFKTPLEDFEKASLAHDLGIVCLVNEKMELAGQLLSEALILRTQVFGEGSKEVNLTMQALQEVKQSLEPQALEDSSSDGSIDHVELSLDEKEFLRRLLEKLDLDSIEEARNLVVQRLKKISDGSSN